MPTCVTSRTTWTTCWSRSWKRIQRYCRILTSDLLTCATITHPCPATRLQYTVSRLPPVCLQASTSPISWTNPPRLTPAWPSRSAQKSSRRKRREAGSNCFVFSQDTLRHALFDFRSIDACCKDLLAVAQWLSVSEVFNVCQFFLILCIFCHWCWVTFGLWATFSPR